MPKDAKLGLIVGVSLVITVGLVFFRKDSLGNPAVDEPPAATVVRPPAPSQSAVPRGQLRPTRARTANQSGDETSAVAVLHRHAVAQGESLADLAQRYYGDRDKSDEIFRANRNVLTNPNELTAGTVLVIPELTAKVDRTGDSTH
jgi:nucleoid-associated protein YgaU